MREWNQKKKIYSRSIHPSLTGGASVTGTAMALREEYRRRQGEWYSRETGYQRGNHIGGISPAPASAPHPFGLGVFRISRIFSSITFPNLSISITLSKHLFGKSIFIR